jgi:hypothetical protein
LLREGACDGQVGLLRLQRNSEDASIGHGVTGIHAEIQQRHFELVRIGAGRQLIFIDLHSDLNLRARAAVDQLGHASDQGRDVDGGGLQRLAPREGKQALD